jgi:hypothetical protein
LLNKLARNFQARGGDNSHSGRDTEPAGCHKSWKRLDSNLVKSEGCAMMKTFQPFFLVEEKEIDILDQTEI